MRMAMGLALAALTMTGAAAAQDATQDNGITVTGQREVPPAEARHFVRQVTTMVDGQFARFLDPVCPTIIGIPDEYAAVIAQRFRAVAREAEVPVGDSRCGPNIVIIIAKDGDRLVRDMRRQAPGLFDGMELNDIRRAMRDGPVHVWSRVQTQGADGQGSSGAASKGETAGSHGAPLGGANTMLVKGVSIINPATRQATLMSVMVIDDDAALGKSLTQIADYAAMRTLAGARPPKDATASDTILTLFDAGASAPPNISLIDRSYLKGLYETRANGDGMMQANRIAKTIARDSRQRSGVE